MSENRQAVLQFRTHHYIQTYVQTDFFCPQCGKPSVWKEDSEGDYYVGPSYFCLACDSFFYMPVEPYVRTDEYGEILRQIKTGVADTPKT